MKLHVAVLIVQISLIFASCDSNFYSQKYKFVPPDKCSNYTTNNYNSTEVELLVPKWSYEEIIVSKCFLQMTYIQKSRLWGPSYSENIIKTHQISPIDAVICDEISSKKMYSGKELTKVDGESVYFIILSEDNKLSSLNYTTRLVLEEVVGYTDGKTIQIPHFPENILYKEGSFIFSNITSIWNTSKITQMENIGNFEILYTSTVIIVPKAMIVFQRTNETLIEYSNNKMFETLKNGYGVLWDSTREDEMFISNETATAGRKKRSISRFVTSTEFTSLMIQNYLNEKNGNSRHKRSVTDYNFNELYNYICLFHDAKVDDFWDLAPYDITGALDLYINNIFHIENWNNGSQEFIYTICLPRPEIFAPRNPDLLKQNQEQENAALSVYIKKLNPLYKVLNSVVGPDTLTLTAVRNSNASEKIERGFNETLKYLDDSFKEKVIELLTSIYGFFSEPEAFIFRIANCIWDAIVSWILKWIVHISVAAIVLGFCVFVAVYFYTRVKGKVNKNGVFYINQQNSETSYISIPMASHVFGSVTFTK